MALGPLGGWCLWLDGHAALSSAGDNFGVLWMADHALLLERPSTFAVDNFVDSAGTGPANPRWA